MDDGDMARAERLARQLADAKHDRDRPTPEQGNQGDSQDNEESS
jgi:hypothetical protein